MIAARYYARDGREVNARLIAGITLLISIVLAVGIYVGVFVMPSPVRG